MIRLTLMFFGLFLSACTSLQSHQNISLSKVESLVVEQSTQMAASVAFGVPNIIVPVDSNQEAWLYLTEQPNPTTRLSLIFDKKSKTLKVINWFVKENDAEYDLKVAQKRYSQAQFIKIENPGNAHAHSNETFYTDSKSGIELIVENRIQKVNAIRWEKNLSQNKPRVPAQVSF